MICWTLVNQSINQSVSVFINSSRYKRIKAAAKGMDGQIQLTTYTIPEHHKTHGNLLKSTPFKPTVKECSDDHVCVCLYATDLLIEESLIDYTCCDAPYSRISFVFHLRRKPRYYVLHLIIPCCLFAFMAAATFILQPSCSERLGLSEHHLRL